MRGLRGNGVTPGAALVDSMGSPMRFRLALLMLALLPGLGLAGVGGLRVCLSVVLGGVDCCTPVAEGVASCCGEDAPQSDAPSPLGAPQGDCTWCCVELEENAPIDDGAPRVEHPPLVLALDTVQIEIVDSAIRVARRSFDVGAPRPPPGARANLPLRI